MIDFIKPTLLTHKCLFFCATKWQVHAKHFCCVSKYNDYLEEKHSWELI